MILSRRSLILSGVTAAAAGSLPGLAYAAAGTPKRLVFIIQRGAADGLATVAPTGDPAFAAARRALADETAGATRSQSPRPHRSRCAGRCRPTPMHTTTCREPMPISSGV